jgi:ectoine hydroxylase-related dioxygenase (phytanoyl-CoA dioxygenase family)
LNTDVSQFAEEGYCFFANVFDADEVAAMQHSLQVAARAGFLKGANYYGEPHSKEAFWLEVCSQPRLLDAVEAVLGPNLILVYSSMFIKMPGDGLSVGWHQDNNYWPSVHGTDVATVWLALDDTDASNAALQIIPGSHRGYRDLDTVSANEKEMLGRKVEVAPEVEATAVMMEMRAGSVSIHDSYILHGSQANKSERRRAGYTIRYCSTDTAWVDMDEHPIPVFLLRGEKGERGERYTDLRPNGV